MIEPEINRFLSIPHNRGNLIGKRLDQRTLDLQRFERQQRTVPQARPGALSKACCAFERLDRDTVTRVHQ
jgi:hypothetical protein